MDNSIVIRSLEIALASTYSLYLKTQNYHWNIISEKFHDFHLMLESQYQALAEAVDILAEQIRSEGAKSPGTFSDFQALSVIKEGNKELGWKDMLSDLYQSHNEITQKLSVDFYICQEAKNEVVCDLYIQRMAEHKKFAWMLKSIIG